MVAVPRSEPLIRPMVADDIPDILQYEGEAYPFPWTEGIFRDCMRVGHQCYVIELDGVLCGYSIYSVAVEECHILNICIGKAYRRRGLAQMFINSIIRHAASAGVKQVYLEVRPSNIAAVKLYESLHFRYLARRRDYYPDKGGREDALVLIRPVTIEVVS